MIAINEHHSLPSKDTSEQEEMTQEDRNKAFLSSLQNQWDDFGSSTLYIKILFADYDGGFAIIELIGEWNDAINNDIMLLKRDMPG